MSIFFFFSQYCVVSMQLMFLLLIFHQPKTALPCVCSYILSRQAAQVEVSHVVRVYVFEFLNFLEKIFIWDNGYKHY